MTSSGTGSELAFDYANNHLEFSDNTRATFGTANDCHIHHNGTDTFISNDTGDLVLNNIGGNSDDIFIRSADDIHLKPQGGEDGIKVIGNGAVELYHDGVKKFETSSTGASITGNLAVSGVLTYDDVTNVDLSLIHI